MIEEQGTVVDTSAVAAVVQATRRSSCGSCGAAAGCGTSLLDRFLGRRPLLLEVDNSLDVVIGDRVVVGVPEASMLRAAAAAYLGPLAGLILGAVIGRHAPLDWLVPGAAAGSEWPSLLGGGLGFVIALLLVARYSRSLARDPRFRPVLLRREAPVAVTLSWG